MLRVWRLYRGGMGVGHLPQAGGTMDQPVIMLDAFAVMNTAQAELEKTHPKKR